MRDLTPPFRSLFFYRQAAVLQRYLIRVQKVSAGPKNDDNLRYCLKDRSKRSIGFGYFAENLRHPPLRSLFLDRSYGHVACALDVSQICLDRNVWLRTIHSEGVQYLLVPGEQRLEAHAICVQHHHCGYDLGNLRSIVSHELSR